MYDVPSTCQTTQRPTDTMTQGDRLLVYRDPDPKGFQTSLILKRVESVYAQAFPEVAFTIDELLGGLLTALRSPTKI